MVLIYYFAMLENLRFKDVSGFINSTETVR